MKKISLLLLGLLTLVAYGQNTPSMQSKFKLDPKLLDGMVIAELPDELTMYGFTENPGTYTDKKFIKRIFKRGDVENILEIYYELYVTTDKDFDDAGVVVLHYDSEESLLNNLSKLKDQSNLAYLIKDNYLIEVWSDVSGEISDTQIENMVKYYETKLGAKRCSVKDNRSGVTNLSQGLN